MEREKKEIKIKWKGMKKCMKKSPKRDKNENEMKKHEEIYKKSHTALKNWMKN